MSEGGLGAWGPPLAILAMAAATYLCRIGGVLLMARVPLTPRVRRALAALPGSIVAATVVPIALGSGPSAAIGILGGIVAMRLARHDLVALACGMACAILARTLGL